MTIAPTEGSQFPLDQSSLSSIEFASNGGESSSFTSNRSELNPRDLLSKWLIKRDSPTAIEVSLAGDVSVTINESSGANDPVGYCLYALASDILECRSVSDIGRSHPSSDVSLRPYLGSQLSNSSSRFEAIEDYPSREVSSHSAHAKFEQAMSIVKCQSPEAAGVNVLDCESLGEQVYLCSRLLGVTHMEAKARSNSVVLQYDDELCANSIDLALILTFEFGKCVVIDDDGTMIRFQQ